MTTTVHPVDQLAEAAATVAHASAWTYLNRHGIRPDSARLAAALARHLDRDFEAAVTDARDAWEAGMTDVAGAMFKAAMTLSGVRAAQEVSVP